MNCRICGKKSEGEFCGMHREAHHNLSQSYDAWRKAMNIIWEEYLRQVQMNPHSGVRAKEVAKHILSSPAIKGAAYAPKFLSSKT